MCFGDDARPPAPPVSGTVGDHGDLVLMSPDGTQFGAYYAHPAEHAANAVVIMPDVRGLHSYYKDLTQRFAEARLHAVAIDYFGRTAGIGPRDEGFPYRQHVERTELPKVAEDVGSAVAWLRQHPGIRSVFTVGFCFGGSRSWAQSAAGHDLSGCIGFYGRPELIGDLVPMMRAPLLLMAAGADDTPVEAVEAFAAQVRGEGVEAAVEVFPGAPHSFFDRSFAEHRDACSRAWQVMLDFVDSHSAKE